MEKYEIVVKNMRGQNIKTGTEITRESRVFAQKTARSIVEIQQRVNTVADVIVFLEIRGYDDSTAKENGYESIHDLAKHIYPFIDMYYNKKAVDKEQYRSFLISEVPGLMRRIPRALVLMFTWMGSLLLLLIIGSTLWVIGFTSEDVRTMIQLSTFLGLIVTEGPWHGFNMLFSLHYSQGNIDEIKRLLKKTYTINGIIIGVTIAALTAFGIWMKLPESTVAISVFMCMAIALHRTSIMIMYALKKINQLMIAYAIGLLAIFLMFYAFVDLIPNYILRYAIALLAAFGVPSAFTIYNHYKLLRGDKRNTSLLHGTNPTFVESTPSNTVSIKSRFRIQMWETTWYFLFGLFSFIVIFEDRLISWIYNTSILASAVERILPFEFNTIYHLGADMALTILLLAALVQYILMSPIHEMIHNKSLKVTITEIDGINKLLRQRYKLMVIGSVATSVILTVIFYLVGPSIVSLVGGAEDSLFVLHYSSIANIFLSLFIVNSQFMILIGRTKHLAILVIAAAIINAAIGFEFAPLNFEYAVYGYVAASYLLFSISTVYIIRLFKNMSSVLFARFV